MASWRRGGVYVPLGIEAPADAAVANG